MRIDNVVFIAGGVGINPIMSMITAMDMQGAGKLGGMPRRIRLYYSSRRRVDKQGNPEEILFEKRLEAIARKWVKKEGVDFGYTLFETSESDGVREHTVEEQGKDERSTYMTVLKRRMNYDDLNKEIKSKRPENTLVYVCGLPSMTDDYVDVIKKAPGFDEKRVLCEKWW